MSITVQDILNHVKAAGFGFEVCSSSVLDKVVELANKRLLCNPLSPGNLFKEVIQDALMCRPPELEYLKSMTGPATESPFVFDNDMPDVVVASLDSDRYKHPWDVAVRAALSQAYYSGGFLNGNGLASNLVKEYGDNDYDGWITPLIERIKSNFSSALEIDSLDYIAANDEGIAFKNNLINALKTPYSAVIAGIYIDPFVLAYSRGVIDTPTRFANCPVAVVGYDSKLDAFRILAPFGPDWGENGFAWVKIKSNSFGYAAVRLVLKYSMQIANEVKPASTPVLEPVEIATSSQVVETTQIATVKLKYRNGNFVGMEILESQPTS